MAFNSKSIYRSILFPSMIAVIVAGAISVAPVQAAAATAKQKRFPSAGSAVNAAVAAARSNNQKELIAIFGAGGKDLLFSGDSVADKERRKRFLESYDEKHTLAPGKGGTVLVVGVQEWPFPIPVVKKNNTWLFDTNKGRQEILNRRIGENESNAIQVSLAVVDAQREYAMSEGNGSELREYAQKFFSDPGEKNGLYWKTNEGEAPSPLGPMAARANEEGYKRTGGKPAPYHGYYYRMLKAQGKNAPGGASDYVVNGRMIGGFAAVAFPAEYGNSGVMTFIVNHDGVVYQKDLGPNTAKVAEAIRAYDPGPGWKKAK